MAEPTVVNGGRRVDLNGNAAFVLDRFIQKLESDVATLREAKAVMLAAYQGAET